MQGNTNFIHLSIMHLNHKILYNISLFLLICSINIIVGCDDDEKGEDVPPQLPNTYLEDNKLIISDILGIPSDVVFNEVKVEISGVDWEVIDIIEADFIDGKATLTLPTGLPTEKLMPAVVIITDKNGKQKYDNTGFWHATTDKPNTLVAGLKDINAYYNGKKVGRVYLSDWIRKETRVGKSWIYYHYVDEPFSLTGSNGIYTYALNFQKGWNAYANRVVRVSTDTYKESVSRTTTIPEERVFFWQFESQ